MMMNLMASLEYVRAYIDDKNEDENDDNNNADRE